MKYRVALVSREVAPFVGGGIAPVVLAAAQQLLAIADVTLVTSSAHRARYEELKAAGDLDDGIRWVFADEPAPDEVAGWNSFLHAWSGRLYTALREAYPEGGPDLIEFGDYLGEGLVTIQARHTHEPWLRDTRIAVRLHTTAEMCAVLDGHLPDDFEARSIHESERYCLRRADRLLWPGGDVLESYRRYFGAENLAPAERIPNAYPPDRSPMEGTGPVPGEDEPLKLLYMGRMERRKGVQNLIRAVTGLPRADIELTMLGGDTKTGALGGSLRAQLQLMAAEDPRIAFYDNVPREDLADWVSGAHVVVVPSLWECWPGTAREAMARNRPLLATPVGGHVEMVQPGRTGWLTRDTSVEALREQIAALAADPEEVAEVIRGGGPLATARAINDPDALRAGYERVLSEPPAPRPRRPRRRPPLVSVIVPYFRLEEHVAETVESALAQTHPAIEVVVVNDGSLRDEDAMLYDLPGVRVVTQANAGLGPARNFGIRCSLGEYVLPLDADDTIAPEFVERCLEGLERDPDLAYVTTWTRYVDEHGVPRGEHVGYQPLGNWSPLIEVNNVAGTCSAVIRRSVFDRGHWYSADLTSYEDWFLYREMHDAGLHGAVVPERLFSYRVRSDSMMREVGQPLLVRLVGEMRAHAVESATQWTAT